jgi:hypothetical protein
VNRTIGSTVPSRHSAAAARLALATVSVGGLCFAVCLAGCVTRRMTVRTNVPGAQVYVDNYEIGRTPASTDFTYYGTRNIRIVKDGFETLTVQQQIAPKWYQIPGIDFLAENVWPFEVRDERQFAYNLQPQYVVPTDALVGRAEELRRANQPTAVVAPTAQYDMINAPPAGLQALPPGSAVYGQPATTPAPAINPAAPVPVNPYGSSSSVAPGMVAPPSTAPLYSSPGVYSAPGTLPPANPAVGRYPPSDPLPPGTGSTPIAPLP